MTAAGIDAAAKSATPPVNLRPIPPYLEKSDQLAQMPELTEILTEPDVGQETAEAALAFRAMCYHACDSDGKSLQIH